MGTDVNASKYETDAVFTRSITAFVAYERGQSAKRTFALTRAESLFTNAIQADPNFAPATLALAQVQYWMHDGSPETASLVARAVATSELLSKRDRQNALGLQALVAERYGDACAIFRQLTTADRSDFGAWFGLGECSWRDSAVVRDPKQPKRLYFRGSFHTAYAALSNAFDLLPSVDPCCVVRADQVLLRTLTTSTAHVRRGRGVGPDTLAYVAYPELLNDTVAYVPYVATDMLRAPPRTHTLAVESDRKAFEAIAQRRVAHSPNDANALEQLAEAMDLRGERGTIDTLRHARRVATSESQRVRLATTEVWTRIKGGLPDAQADLVGARQLAESLVAHTKPQTPDDASMLTSLAVLLRLPAAVLTVATASAKAIPSLGIATSVMECYERFLAFASIGGPRDSLSHSEQQLVNAIANDVAQPQQSVARDMLLGRAVGVAYPSYRAVSLGALDTSDYLLAAEQAHSRGDMKAVRAILERVARTRASMRAADITFDALYPEAWLLVAAGDTTGALKRIGSALASTHSVATRLFLEGPNAGGLVHAVSLQATLMERTGRSRSA